MTHETGPSQKKKPKPLTIEPSGTVIIAGSILFSSVLLLIGMLKIANSIPNIFEIQTYLRPIRVQVELLQPDSTQQAPAAQTNTGTK